MPRPPSLPRAAARPHRAPSPEYHPAAARTHWARLVRIAPTACRRPHRIYPTACRHPHPSMSPPSRSRAHRPPITTIVRRRRLARVALRRPHRAHRAPTSASPPPISLLALRRPQGPGRQEPRRMHPFFAECAKKALFLATSARNACSSRSRWQHPRPMHPISGRNRAIQDTWRVNLAAKGPFSRRGARNHAWREDVASVARPFRGSGMRHGRTGFAPCGSGLRSGGTGFAPCGAGLACLPHAPPLPSCLCPPRPAPPAISPAFSAAEQREPRFAVRDPPRGPRTDASRHLRAAPIPPAALTHRVQETSGTTQTTQCGHKNRIPKWGPY